MFSFVKNCPFPHKISTRKLSFLVPALLIWSVVCMGQSCNMDETDGYWLSIASWNSSIVAHGNTGLVFRRGVFLPVAEKLMWMLQGYKRGCVSSLHSFKCCQCFEVTSYELWRFLDLYAGITIQVLWLMWQWLARSHLCSICPPPRKI